MAPRSLEFGADRPKQNQAVVATRFPVDEVLPAGELDKRVESYVRILASRSQLTQAAAL